jgi:branched-chain amino acid transport system ATP-binding protein
MLSVLDDDGSGKMGQEVVGGAQPDVAAPQSEVRPLLEVRELEVTYGPIRAVRGLSLQVQLGQAACLIGANGAGKSTTLNTISGLIKPAGGKVLFDGQDITGWPADRVVGLGLVQVPEGRMVIATMRVVENLEMGAYLRRDGAAVRRDLEAIWHSFPRLAERRNQNAGLLSGGEQQMLALGRALMARPRLLMLDEPSMGLAPILVNEVFAALRQVKSEGVTILLVEQNARKALEMSDYAYVLERGRLAHEGEAQALRRDPRVTAAYLGQRQDGDVAGPV